MKNLFLLLAFVSFLLISCTNGKSVDYLTREKAEKVAAEFMYYSKDGLSLRLTDQEAKEKRISSEDYKDFQDIVKRGNEMLKKQLDSLNEKSIINFAFPKERFEPEGVDPRIILQDDTEKEFSFGNK